MIIVSAIFGALAQAAPERVCAAGSDSSVVTVIGGVDPRPERRGRRYVYIECQGSAWGANCRSDGASGLRFGVGNTGNQPIEVVEAEYPVTVLEYSLVPDRAGAGTCRGGVPARRVTRLDGPAQVTLIAERGRIAPFGMQGGKPGALGEYVLNPGTPQEVKLFSKTAPIQRQQGESLSICAAGGGGYGAPHQRDPARIQRDIEAGLLSPEVAARDYGTAQ
jgi:N-methylhydantoinase B